MSSLEALLPDDLEKHVQMNRARLTSYCVLREEIRTYCKCRCHANARNVKQEGSSHPGGHDPRASETNTDDREVKRVRIAESRGLKRQGADVEELAAMAD